MNQQSKKDVLNSLNKIRKILFDRYEDAGLQCKQNQTEFGQLHWISARISYDLCLMTVKSEIELIESINHPDLSNESTN